MSRRRKWQWVLTVLALGVFALGAVVANIVWFTPFSIDIFFERVFIRYALMNPEMLTDLRVLEPYGITGHNGKLTDSSPAFSERMWELNQDNLDTLHRYHRDSLTRSQQISYDILEWYLDDGVRGKEFLHYDYPVNQLFGVQNDLPSFMAMKHQVNNKHDADQYVERLNKFGQKFDEVIQSIKLRESQGIVPPKFVLAKVLQEMDGFAKAAPKENILYTSFCEKLGKAKGLSNDEIQATASQVETAIQQSVYPAYTKLAEELKALDAHATTDDGVWKFPNGDAFYRYVLRSSTTTDMTPEEVHQLGLAEVERITREMHEILATVGRGDKSVGEAMTDLRKDPQFLYPDSDDARDQCLKDYQSIIDEVDKGLSGAFDLRPKLGVEVKRVPPFRENGAPGAYYEPASLDGSRPGVFFANLRKIDDIPKWGMKTLAYHEAIPGHHFQIDIQQQIKGPTFRKVLPFTAFMEGWALYAERLAWELGFEKDPYDNLGRLQAELFRAVRLVVDTGIHYKRWTREQAIDYMRTTTGMGETEVTAEIERYIVMPGQACAYKIGMMKILECRERTKKALGEKFTLKDFHNVVLSNGALPLTVLDKMVDRYIAENTGK